MHDFKTAQPAAQPHGVPPMKLIAGLGNPGAAYDLTRHNIGFMAVDRLAAETGITLHNHGFHALIGRGNWSGHEIMLAKPLTFMNHSGIALQALADAFSVGSEDIIIVHDDMDLPFGAVRIKTGGGSGGHKGVASLHEQLSSDAFLRLRIGIGRPGGDRAASEYVLDRFSDTELKKIDTVTGSAVQCLEMLLTHGIPAAMNKFHVKPTCSQEHGAEPAAD